jgi:hypothetical protein
LYSPAKPKSITVPVGLDTVLRYPKFPRSLPFDYTTETFPRQDHLQRRSLVPGGSVQALLHHLLSHLALVGFFLAHTLPTTRVHPSQLGTASVTPHQSSR